MHLLFKKLSWGRQVLMEICVHEQISISSCTRAELQKMHLTAISCWHARNRLHVACLQTKAWCQQNVVMLLKKMTHHGKKMSWLICSEEEPLILQPGRLLGSSPLCQTLCWFGTLAAPSPLSTAEWCMGPCSTHLGFILTHTGVMALLCLPLKKVKKKKRRKGEGEEEG